MREIIAEPRQAIVLGIRGENEATRVAFPKSYFAEFDLTGGEFRLLAQRNGDANPYPVTVTEDDTNVYWTVSGTDCAIYGQGKCELQFTVGTLLAKSIVYVTVTGISLDTEGPLPEPYEDWADDLYATIDEKVGAAQQAVTDAHAEVLLAKQEVTNAHAEYLLAKAQAEAAAGSASDAQGYAKTAHDEVQKFNVTVSGDGMFITVSGEEEAAIE